MPFRSFVEFHSFSVWDCHHNHPKPHCAGEVCGEPFLPRLGSPWPVLSDAILEITFALGFVGR